MDTLTIDLENCYGIRKMSYTFDFTSKRVYAIYASNGCMKTSLAKTFKNLSDGENPRDDVALLTSSRKGSDASVDTN
jgi:hypothetical protein